ncbi:peptidoglycan-associated lipoprotein Pal [Novispirillum sp. DQ9]|uniref:peptidoglycan-associated lipoprotein Pal n=1 Tax=Novispirillum sp. DQ9 TaxID=3398612 RepID=UPI003C7BCD6E
MKYRLLPAIAAAALLAACSTAPQEDAGATGAGAGAGTGTTTTQTGPAPGSAEEFMKVVGDRVFFGYDQYSLTPEAQAALRQQAAWLQRYRNHSVVLEGHADERGTREYNLALGERRANSVREFLAAQGVDAGRIRVISYGKERPVCGDSAESCWTQNRRGVTVLQ